MPTTAGFSDGVLRLDVGAGIVLSIAVPAGVEPALQAGDEELEPEE